MFPPLSIRQVVVTHFAVIQLSWQRKTYFPARNRNGN